MQTISETSKRVCEWIHLKKHVPGETGYRSTRSVQWRHSSREFHLRLVRGSGPCLVTGFRSYVRAQGTAAMKGSVGKLGRYLW